MIQTLRRPELKIYKSIAFWSMINQTFGLSKGEHLKNLQIYREKRPYVPNPEKTKIENLQIYSILEHDQPNFWAQQRDIISKIYKSTKKSDHMLQVLRRPELKIYESTAFWSIINQTFGLRKRGHLKNLQIYTEKGPCVPAPVKIRIENLQIYSILEHVTPNFWAQQKDDLNILRIYGETRIYVLDPRNTRIENLQIYSVLEHVIPNFWAQQKDDISLFYNSTEKRAYMFWTLGTQELKIYKSTVFWSM